MALKLSLQTKDIYEKLVTDPCKSSRAFDVTSVSSSSVRRSLLVGPLVRRCNSNIRIIVTNNNLMILVPRTIKIVSVSIKALPVVQRPNNPRVSTRTWGETAN